MREAELAQVQHAARERQEARDRIFLSAFFAGVQAVFLLAFELAPRLRTGEWGGIVEGVLLGPVLVAWLGYALYRWQSRIAAGLLLAGVVLGFAGQWMDHGRVPSVLIYGGLAFVHLRAFLGTLHLADARAAGPGTDHPP